METQYDHYTCNLLKSLRIDRIFLSDIILRVSVIFSFLTKIISIPLALWNYLINFCAIDIETTYTNQVSRSFVLQFVNFFFCRPQVGGRLFVRIKP